MRLPLLTELRRATLTTMFATLVIVSGSCSESSGPEMPRAVKLTVISQPAASVAAGASLSFQVAVQDANGNTVKNYPAIVSVSLNQVTFGGQLTGTVNASTENGIATFNSLQIARAGTLYSINVSSQDPALSSTTTNTFTVTPAVPARLTVTGQPSSTVTSLSNISPSVQITAEDLYGNVANNATTEITIALSGTGGTAGAVLGGTATRSTTSGVATFNNLTVDKSGTNYQLTATATGLTSVTTTGFNVNPGVATKLAFSVQPASSGSGAAISPSVQVVAQDAAGNNVPNTSSAPDVVVSITSGTGTTGAVLAGTTTRTLSLGVAVFDNLKVDKVGIGYTLTATTASYSSATSAPFDVTVGGPAQLAIITQPTNVVAGAAISPGVQVEIRDAGGNKVVSSTASVTLAIGTNPGSATLGGLANVFAVGGVATFPSLTLNRVGAGYRLTATAVGLTSATSSTFSVTVGAPSKLAFDVQPTTSTPNGTITPSVQVVVQDASGNNVPTGTGDVSLAITSGTGASGAALSGTITRSLSSGIATFDDVKIDKVGTGYTLTASASAYASANSASFDVAVGAPSQLAIVAQPANVAAGVVITPSLQVEVRDAGGNRITTSTASVTIAIQANPGSASLGGTVTVAAVAGVATFNNLTLNKIGTGYKLVASSSGLASATTVTFNVLPGVAAALTFSVQPPSSRSVNTTFNSAVAVSITDVGGNVVTTATNPITIALGSNAAGAALGGTTTVNAVSGVAMFPTLTLDKPGQSFTLQATATGLTSVTSTAITIIGPVTTLVFTSQPVSGVRNATMPGVVISLRDAADNVVTSANNTVSIAFGANPGGGTLGGTVSKSASSGVATFGDLSVNAAGTSYTLVASATGASNATSSSFDVAAFGPATKLAFVAQPSSADMATIISPAIQVAVLDAVGNTVTTSSASVTVGFAANPGSATLGGTLTTSASSGVATFSNLTVSTSGSSYTLAGTSPSLTPATSTAFNVVNPGAALKLAFLQHPTGTTAGSTIVPAVSVAVQNSSGATVTSDNSTVVSITVATGPVGGTVGGILSATAVNGVATFNALKDTVAGAYTLRASATGLNAGTSSSYTITAGVASGLRFLTQPTSTVAGDPFAQPVVVAVVDAFGNTVPGATNTVTVGTSYYYSCPDSHAWQLFGKGVVHVDFRGCTGSAGTVPLGGTTSVAAVAGVASFPGLRPRLTEIARVTASAPGLASTASNEITVSPGAAYRVWTSVYGVAPTANQSFQVQAFLLDSLNNQRNTGSNLISLAIGSNPSAASLAVANNISATAGRVDFTVSLDKAGTGFTIDASSPGLSTLSSFAFNVAPFGTASRLAFTVQPSNASAGASIAPAVTVCVQDSFGNTVTTAANTIAVAIGANPGTSALSGTVSTAAAIGCATFSNLSLNNAGTGYTLSATATSLTAATSASFNITP